MIKISVIILTADGSVDASEYQTELVWYERSAVCTPPNAKANSKKSPAPHGIGMVIPPPHVG